MSNHGALFITALCLAAAIATFWSCKQEMQDESKRLFAGIFSFPLHPNKPSALPSGPSAGGAVGTPCGSADGACAMGDADPITAFHSRSNELGA